MSNDTLRCRQALTINGKTYDYFSLHLAAEHGLGDISRLPFSLKILLENLLRHEDGHNVKREDMQAFAAWLREGTSTHEIGFIPARVLMQDYTGVPAIVDLAAMRDAMKAFGGDPQRINPLSEVDLVIDHSVQVDLYGSADAMEKNVALEVERNRERYRFLRWGQQAFKNFRVVPPGTGICHQVNLEYLAKTVWSRTINGKTVIFPDTLVGTDSHTPMINGLGVLGWGVGGIEAEAAMLGQPVSMVIPEVIGCKLSGKLNEGITATDLVLTITQQLRAYGVVGKFIEFYGDGLNYLPVADRATIANMAPEYGATCSFFPVDEETLRYLRLTGRDAETIALVKMYCQQQGLWRDNDTPTPVFTATLALDLGTVQASLAGPKRPQDRVNLRDAGTVMAKTLEQSHQQHELDHAFPVNHKNFALHHGDLVIAAITSCTNTSNPTVMITAGLLARKAAALGLKTKPWVKTSLAPGSQVVTEYLRRTRLLSDLETLGFYVVGYGCTTCIGNSGPLDDDIAHTITQHDMYVCSILSGNRNFEGRIHPLTKGNWLASPPLVIAYALTGTLCTDLSTTPLGYTADGRPVLLKDIWPTAAEVQQCMTQVTHELFGDQYADVFKGDHTWQTLPIDGGNTFTWSADSTYISNPPYFAHLTKEPSPLQDIHQAHILAMFGDSITTDHISPAGSIKPSSPAGLYLQERGVNPKDFNSYGARRGNHEVMVRGTFANIRIRNELLPGVEGGVTLHIPSHQTLSIYDAAIKYQQENIPLVIIAGKEYGSGSSRDWAAKGTSLLGVKAVIAESFERIHRSNLVGMGILPLEFKSPTTRHSLALTGFEKISITGVTRGITPGMELSLSIHHTDGSSTVIPVKCRIDTENEARYYHHGGILPKVLRDLL